MPPAEVTDLLEPVVRLARELIAIKSVNPCFPDGNGEGDLAQFIYDFARKKGLDVSLQPVSPGRSNVLIRRDGNGKETILLEGHMDTVTAEGMTIDPFDPLLDDDRLYGRGACDAKGCLAAMLQSVADKKGQQGPDVLLAAVVDEENGFSGVQALVASGIKADFAVVGEPTQLAVVIAHKGVVRGFVKTRGISAHTSQPEEGINAIQRMARLLLVLDRYDKELRMKSHSLVGSATLTVSFIQGGRGLNLVPDECTVGLDRRTLPSEDPMLAWEELRRFLKSQPEFVEGEGLLEEPVLVNRGMEIAADSLPVQRLMAAIRSLGFSSEPIGVPYTTDAGELVRGGIASVVFGPGNIQQAHKADEWISVQQLRQAKAIFDRLIAGGE
ncbi:MAG: ArgE/DapE family deacylase [Armatimonadetes bacterium]|nr:ArgE/DapE family deacylase [Armatimonadota bacterium]MDW8122481.1 ArgE/DapE family deacylase [Armatimonadota bacterium]